MPRGCVTPEQIKNIKNFIEGDMDLLEGYDEMPQDARDKVDFAIEHGHVPDEDWKGVSAEWVPATTCQLIPNRMSRSIGQV